MSPTAQHSSSLNPKQRRHLRGLSHTLKPIVMLGNAGLTDNILNEIDLGLGHHELIKVRISGMERDERAATSLEICRKTACKLVNSIGHIAVLYRPAKPPRIKLPR
ncbi:MAG: ribosome assembly RNA-binding protein YhbY [Gammaproteobacteria bacterium]|nr:ribosome assembly RNA-binding protein YhbY [Gammaproteobacteria bacterium]